MTHRTHSCPSNEDLVSYLYGEDDDGRRPAIEAHVAACTACHDEVAALGGVRAQLAEWSVPELDAHVAVVSERPARTARSWDWLLRPAFALPAAAVLVLGVAAGVANLEVRYGAEGLVVRTGWAARADAAPTATVQAAVAGEATAGPTRASLPAGGSGEQAAPWRAELTALEQQLRREFLSNLPPRTQAARASAPGAGRLDPETLRRLQALVDESEQRQRRNLALRVAELARDFDVQRKADLVQIQQGFGRLEGRTEAEAARAREMMNYIVRVSQQGRPR